MGKLKREIAGSSLTGVKTLIKILLKIILKNLCGEEKKLNRNPAGCKFENTKDLYHIGADLMPLPPTLPPRKAK